MDIVYHHQIKRDLRTALAYYDAEGGSRLGDRFFDEVEAAVARVNENPKGCHFAADGVRRENWIRSPIISSMRRTEAASGFSFYATTGNIRVLV